MRPGLGTSPSRRAAAGPNPAEAAAAQRESEDLKSKIKILEKKRMEDREKLKTLERIQEEKDKYETIIQKLQQKYAPQQQEIVELRKQVKDMETEMVAMEEEKAEHDMILEMATLDREMAEEQSEAYKAELDAVRAKAEEYEMEVEILREENEELGQGMTPEEKTSSGWLQLEKQNERLRDALLRLREITSQAEDELKDTVQSLEEDNTELQKYKDEYETTKERLIASESAVDDLRQQLETALGAEEMLEELTERNMNMGEQVDELRATVEDLESLKEIADELEINHVESEKQMQEELDYRDFLISEQAKRVAQLDSSNEEAEYTITRYRDVVLSLQSDLEDMRASQQITETESENLTARSRAMMDLNMKLQITAAKAQNKTIDLELRRLEAEEAMEHLAVVQVRVLTIKPPFMLIKPRVDVPPRILPLRPRLRPRAPPIPPCLLQSQPPAKIRQRTPQRTDHDWVRRHDHGSVRRLRQADMGGRHVRPLHKLHHLLLGRAILALPRRTLRARSRRARTQRLDRRAPPRRAQGITVRR